MYDYWNLPSAGSRQWSEVGTIWPEIGDEQYLINGKYVTLTFLLASNKRSGPTDRLIYITVEWETGGSINAAERLRDDLLPVDAEAFGQPYPGQFNYPIQPYDSPSVAEQFPMIPTIDDFGPPGRIWTSTYQDISGWIVLEILLYDRWG